MYQRINLLNTLKSVYTYSTLKSISKPHYDSSLRLDWNNLAKYMPNGTGETVGCGKEATGTCNLIKIIYTTKWYKKMVGGTVASWLVRSTPEQAVWVRALARDSVLCSWTRHFTLTVPLSTKVYKWVPAICWRNLTKLRGSDLQWTSIPSRGSRNTSSRFMLQKPG